MFVGQQVAVVDSDLELLVCAEDLHLERLSSSEGEAGTLPLLPPPLVPDPAVPHDHLLPVLVETWVEVECQVLVCVQIHHDLVRVWFDASNDGDQQFVVNAVGQRLGVRHRQILLGGNSRTRSRSK